MTSQLTSVMTGTISAAAEPDGRPPRVLRRRISARQALANGLTIAWRNVIQLKHSPASTCASLPARYVPSASNQKES